MEIINKYFGKIIFTKADLRENHSIYVASLSSSFQDGRKQYALAFVPIHLAIINKGYLSDLHWVNLQTRIMTNGYRLAPQRWEIPKGLDTPMFTAVERTESKTKYVSDIYPLEMVLMHDPKKKSKFQYHGHINLLAALATFKCVISLTESSSNSSGGGRSEYAQNSTSLSLGSTPWIPNYPSILPNPEYDPQPEYVLGDRNYTPGADGRYVTIGLSDYTTPKTIPNSRTNKKNGEPMNFGGNMAKKLLSEPTPTMISPEQIDDSFEFIQ
jgi:hypothetical protein